MTDFVNDRLAALERDIKACRTCIETPTQKRPLPHEPRPVAVLSGIARILIAGQAPGLRVHETGIPFNDASGDRLRQWLDVTREQFYDRNLFAILPMGFCFPGYDGKGSDLPPRKECAPKWRSAAMEAMPQIDLILTIGSYAQVWHMPENRRSMTATVSDWETHFSRNGTPSILPLPHPSWRNTGWLKRHPWFESEVLPRLRQMIRDRLS